MKSYKFVNNEIVLEQSSVYDLVSMVATLRFSDPETMWAASEALIDSNALVELEDNTSFTVFDGILSFSKTESEEILRQYKVFDDLITKIKTAGVLL